MDVSAHGGTSAPFIFDCAINDSAPNTNAECTNPDSWIQDEFIRSQGLIEPCLLFSSK